MKFKAYGLFLDFGGGGMTTEICFTLVFLQSD